MKPTRLPPARKKQLNVLFLLAAVLLVIAGPTLIPLAFGAQGSVTLPVFFEIAGGLTAGIALGWLFLWVCYRPGRRLFRVMTEANPGLQVVPFYSSAPFISGVKELTGTTLASSESPSGAFLMLVETGRNFELWRWYRGGARRVGRFAWSTITAADVGTVSHFVTTDRAIVLTMQIEGRAIEVPISPQACHSVRLKPVDDDAFAGLVGRWQQRVVTSRHCAVTPVDGGVANETDNRLG